MWRPYGAVTHDGSAVGRRLDVAIPAESAGKLDLVTLIIQPIPTNTGRVYICSSANSQPTAVPPTGILAWLPPPSPGNAPFIKIIGGLRVGTYFLFAEMPNEGVVLSGIVQ